MTQRHDETIRFSGTCSIAGIEACRRDLVRAFGAGGSITADLSGVDKVDVSFVQLMVSAARTAAGRDGSFAIVSVPEAVAASFRAAGVDVGRLLPTASGH